MLSKIDPTRFCGHSTVEILFGKKVGMLSKLLPQKILQAFDSGGLFFLT